MIFHADSESDLKTTPNQIKIRFYGTSTLNSPYGMFFEFFALRVTPPAHLQPEQKASKCLLGAVSSPTAQGIRASQVDRPTSMPQRLTVQVALCLLCMRIDHGATSRHALLHTY